MPEWGKTIRPMWVCFGCRASVSGTHDHDHPDYWDPPSGWFRVWRGFRGWEWSFPACSLKGRERD